MHIILWDKVLSFLYPRLVLLALYIVQHGERTINAYTFAIYLHCILYRVAVKHCSERNIPENELVFLVCWLLLLVFEPYLMSLKIFYHILCFVGITRFTMYFIWPLPCSRRMCNSAALRMFSSCWCSHGSWSSISDFFSLKSWLRDCHLDVPGLSGLSDLML
jgi:hypothetical protein